VTGQHLLLLLWTLWILFALVSIGDLLGVILALVFGLLGAGLIPTGLASWRGYVIAGLIVHVIVAVYMVAVLRGWLRPASGRPGLRPLWGWAHNSLLQTIFGSVSLVGLASVLYLRPTIPWKYRADIPLMILVVIAVVAVEYALLAGSWRFKRRENQEPVSEEREPEPDLLPAPPELETVLVQPNSDADQTSTGNTVEGRVVDPERLPSPDGVANHGKFEEFESRLTDVELRISQHEQDDVVHLRDPHVTASDPSAWYLAADPVRSWAGSDELAAGAVRIELLRIARLTERQGSSSDSSPRLTGITIERRAVVISPESAVTVRQVTARATERLGQDIEAYGAAQPITKPYWEVVSQRWVQADSSDMDTAARIVTDFGAALDSILRNKPVQRVFSWAGAPGLASAVNGGDADAQQVALVGGIVVGTRSGQPVPVSACFRALTTDPFTRNLAAGIAGKLGAHGLSLALTPPSTHRLAG